MHANKVLNGLHDSLTEMVEECAEEYPDLLINDGVHRIRQEMCI
jgi:hypothetical protein